MSIANQRCSLSAERSLPEWPGQNKRTRFAAQPSYETHVHRCNGQFIRWVCGGGTVVSRDCPCSRRCTQRSSLSLVVDNDNVDLGSTTLRGCVHKHARVCQVAPKFSMRMTRWLTSCLLGGEDARLRVGEPLANQGRPERTTQRSMASARNEGAGRRQISSCVLCRHATEQDVSQIRVPRTPDRHRTFFACGRVGPGDGCTLPDWTQSLDSFHGLPCSASGHC